MRASHFHEHLLDLSSRLRYSISAGEIRDIQLAPMAANTRTLIVQASTNLAIGLNTGQFVGQ